MSKQTSTEGGGLFRGRNARTIVPAILEIVREFDLLELLPLTVRQVYYQLYPKKS